MKSAKKDVRGRNRRKKDRKKAFEEGQQNKRRTKHAHVQLNEARLLHRWCGNIWHLCWNLFLRQSRICIQPTKNRCTQLHITLYTNWITFSVFYIHNWTWDNIFHSIEPILLLQYCIILVKFAFFTVRYRMWLELSRFFMMFLVFLWFFSSFPSLSRTYLYQIVSMWKFLDLSYQTSPCNKYRGKIWCPIWPALTKK